MPYLRDEWRTPGIFIRDALIELKEASPAQVHRRYRQRIREENRLRDRGLAIKPMTYPSMVRYVRLLEALGAVERTGTAPIDPNYEQLIRCSPEGFLPAVQILYQLVAPADSPLLLKPWTSSRRLPAPPPPAVRPKRPRVVRPPKPRPVKVTIVFAPLEEKMRELHGSVSGVVGEPSLKRIRAVGLEAKKLHADLAESAKKAPKATAAERTKLADMSSQIRKVMEALDRFQAAFEAVGKETLPRRVAAARRSLEAAGNLLLEEAEGLLLRA